MSRARRSHISQQDIDHTVAQIRATRRALVKICAAYTFTAPAAVSAHAIMSELNRLELALTGLDPVQRISPRKSAS